MHYIVMFLVLLSAPQGGAMASSYSVGGYADESRSTSCVVGPAGSTFQHVVWTFVPGDAGLTYVTFHFQFPSNIELGRNPVFHEQVTVVNYADYSDDTTEWHVVFNGCPSGWIQVFSQEIVLLDEQPSVIGIRTDGSWVRDCDFVLNEVDIVSQLSVNGPDCEVVATDESGWSTIKSRYLRLDPQQN